MFAPLCAALVVLAATSLASDHPTLAIGSPAPDFRLPGVDDQEYTLASFAEAKVLAVVFTSNHCPTAQAYEERLKRLVIDYAPRGVAFVAINPNHAPAVRLDEMGYTDLGDSFDEMKIRAAHRGFNFPYLDDGPDERAAQAYGPIATPHVFIFDAPRRLRFQGRLDDSEDPAHIKSHDARAAIDALLAGTEPPVTQTKVFGCSVKWKDKTEGNTQWLAKVAKEPVTLEVGDAATLQSLRANASGKIRMINVWATWCGPCVAEFDDLIEMNLRFRHRDFELITVAAEPPAVKDKVLAFLRKHRASTRNLIFGDPDKYQMIEAVDPAWNGALPYTLILGPKGEVLYRETGTLDLLEARRAIVPALNAITPWPGLSGPG